MADSETHVAVSHEGEAEHTEHEEAAAAAVATAGAAVALAHETAAHAELQAAEEVAEVEERQDEWRRETGEAVSSLSANLASLNSRLDELTSLNRTRLEGETALLERLAALEAHPSLRSIPPASENEEEETTAQETTEENPLVGGEVAANVGPVEAASSASLQNPLSPSEEPRPKRKRHWI